MTVLGKATYGLKCLTRELRYTWVEPPQSTRQNRTKSTLSSICIPNILDNTGSYPFWMVDVILSFQANMFAYGKYLNARGQGITVRTPTAKEY